MAIGLLALSLVTLLVAAITVILTQSLRLAGGNENGISFIATAIFVLGIVLVFPIFFVFAYIVNLLKEWVGTRCPSCGKRKLEWRSGRWQYGDPPDHLYFACGSCGARFRQLWGGMGVLSDLEKV